MPKLLLEFMIISLDWMLRNEFITEKRKNVLKDFDKYCKIVFLGAFPMSIPPNQVIDLIFTYNLARIMYFHIFSLSVKEYKSKKSPKSLLAFIMLLVYCERQVSESEVKLLSRV